MRPSIPTVKAKIMTDTPMPTAVTFEAGYDRLKVIADRIDQEEVPVSELCDLFAEGKGLELALTNYLETQKARLETIERGDGVQAFRIVAADADEAGRDGARALDVDDCDFQAARVGHADDIATAQEGLPL